MRGRPPGSVVKLRVNYWAPPPPVEGDFLRTATGTCYRIDDVRQTRTGRVHALVCTKLEQDAVAAGQAGVWEWAWSPRRRRRRM